MSHTVKIETKIKATEFKNLVKAFNHFGWQIKENSKMRTYSQYGAEADRVSPFVAVNPSSGHNAYDVGIEVGADNIELFTDFYGGSVASSLGDNFNKLKQEHAFRVIEDEYAWNGANVTRSFDAHQNMIVNVEQY